MNANEPDAQVTNKDERYVGSPVGSSQAQPPATKPTENAEKISACTEYFEYIASMPSLEDSYFKHTIRKELMMNQKAALSAFNKLPLESV